MHIFSLSFILFLLQADAGFFQLFRHNVLKILTDRLSGVLLVQIPHVLLNQRPLKAFDHHAEEHDSQECDAYERPVHYTYSIGAVTCRTSSADGLISEKKRGTEDPPVEPVEGDSAEKRCFGFRILQ